MKRLLHGSLLGLMVLASSALAQPFQLPTSNRAILEPGGDPRFFVGTAGKTWTSGVFGCVRSGGGKFHEGIDIRAVRFDKKGEPLDEVMASADGTVAYISRKAGLSNYGKYVVLRHRIEGIEVLTLYAHLAEIRSGLAPGTLVRAGETIARMGRTTNTRERISRDRAHLHFEVDFMASMRFQEWFSKHLPGQPNDHGLYNGRNLIGLDPRWIFLAQAQHGTRFSLAQFLRSQPMMFKLLIRDPHWAWAQRQTALVQADPNLPARAVGGFEVSFNYNGVPYKVVPRSKDALGQGGRVEVIEVDEGERAKHPCRGLVRKEGSGWSLTPAGAALIDLLGR